MAFPTTPTNGQQSVVNGITYQYASASNSWTRVGGIANTISATGNITAGNLLTGGVVSATGNITGNYFFGNGSQLTGISSSSSGGGNLWVVGRTATYYVPIISGVLTIVSRSGNISVPIIA